MLRRHISILYLCKSYNASKRPECRSTVFNFASVKYVFRADVGNLFAVACLFLQYDKTLGQGVSLGRFGRIHALVWTVQLTTLERNYRRGCGFNRRLKKSPFIDTNLRNVVLF